ncbi:hypothetical protein C8R48DRAFT_683234 [Suillus tomentosus]|nr:hypothetical protein C8R48DRAFT_683234 [Suillus tomentosus]
MNVLSRFIDGTGNVAAFHKGLFYGVVRYRPFLVPVPVRDGVERETTLDDLYVNYWVRQRNTDDCTATRRHLRRTFTTIPDSAMTLDNQYTLFLERPRTGMPTNHVLARMGSLSGDHEAVYSS